MNVIPTGIIFYGVCQVVSEHCHAKEGGAITAVHTLPFNEQVNVCKTCLDYQIRERIWNIEGAYVPNMKRMLDLAVVDSSGKVVIAVEVKNRQDINQQSATQIATQIVAREQIFSIPFFFLVTPTFCYSWEIINGSLNNLQAISVASYLPKIYEKLGIPFTDSNATESHKTQSTSLSKAKEHLLLERVTKNLFGEKCFIHLLPKKIADQLESSQVHMEYVLPNA
jgi:hypothetical protein